MGSLGVLHLGSLHGHSVGDHRDVLTVPVGGVSVTSVPVTIVPGSSAALGLSDGGKVGSLGVGDLGGVLGSSVAHVSVSLGLGDGGKVNSLSVSNLGSVDDTTVGSQGSVGVHGGVDGGSGQGALVGGKVGSLGGLHLGGLQWHSVVQDDGGSGVPGSVHGTLVDAVSQTSVSGKVGSLGSGDLGGVLGHSSDGGVGSQVGGTGSLDLGGVNWDSVVANHDRGVGVCPRSSGVSPGSGTVGPGGRVQHLRLVGDSGSPATQAGSNAQSGNNLKRRVRKWLVYFVVTTGDTWRWRQRH